MESEPRQKRHCHHLILWTGYKIGLSVIIISITAIVGGRQVLRRFKSDIILHIQKNLTLYLVVLFAILTGIASGIFTASSMTNDQKLALGSYLEGFFQQNAHEPVNRTIVFWQSLKQNLQSSLFIWLAGLTLFGIPFIFFFVGIRSFFIGFAFGFLLDRYRVGGFLFTLLCILPQTLIFLIGFLLTGVIAMEHSLDRFKNRKLTLPKEQLKRETLSYTLKTLALFVFLTIGSLLEAYITPAFFGLFGWVFN
jgi:stage II sporulation protein M